MGRGKRIITLLVATAALVVSPAMRADDTGLIVGMGIEKKITKKVSLEANAEFRTRNDFKTVDHITAAVSGKYKFNKWLKADAGYQLIVNNNPEHLTLHDDGSYNNWRPSFYGLRHRFSVSLTGDVNVGRFNVSLRERWQYTLRPKTTTTRYDFDNEYMEDCTVRRKDHHTLRSRVKVDYNIPHCKFTPAVSAEFYTSTSLEKTRFTVGGNYTLKKHHSFEVGYHYQLYNHTVKPEAKNTHHIVLGYTFKF